MSIHVKQATYMPDREIRITFGDIGYRQIQMITKQVVICRDWPKLGHVTPDNSTDETAGNDERSSGAGRVGTDDIRWMSTAEAATRLGITPRTLYRFIDEGQLPAYRFGRVIRLKADEVDTFIDACRITPGTLEHLYPDSTSDTSETAAKGT